VTLEGREGKREIKSNPAFNYGVYRSYREIISSSNEYNRYFQKLDKEMYLKTIERKIVDTLSQFLDIKNIDASDFKETKSTILNNGVIVSGGNVSTQNLTVGKNPTSIINTVTDKSDSKK
jgi:capsular polysaccharide biosynthesis protein